MAPFPYRLVTVDIDGTLTVGHGWRFLADQVGRGAEYERAQAAFRSGTEGEDGHLRNLLALARGLSRRQVAEILAATPRVGGIGSGVHRLHQLGARVALLTHNPSYVCAWYAREFHLDGFDGMTHSPKFRAGRIPDDADGVRADKVAGLRRLTERFRIVPGEVAHVGDGTADAAVFPLVGLGVAFGAVDPLVEKAADIRVGGRDFRAVVRALETHPPARP